MKKLTRSRSERRLHPRLIHQLPMNVIADGYDFVTTSQNISCVGAYCRIAKYIPPFTRIMVKLQLPSSKWPCVECKGVVVRTEDNSQGGFNIAIFFNEIKDAQRKFISEYISQFLPQGHETAAYASTN